MAKLHRFNRSADFFSIKLRKAGFDVQFDFVDCEFFSEVEVRERNFNRVVGYFSTPRAAYNHLFGTHY